MPWTAPSRRTLLTGTAGVLGTALLTGCSEPETGAGSRPSPAVPLDRRIREAAVRDSRALLERYDATLAAHPALAGRLAPLRAAVAAHAAALSPDGAAAGAAGPKASGAAGPKASATPAPSETPGAPGTSGAPAAQGSVPSVPPVAPVPPKPADAVAALADAERSLAENRTVALAEAPGELARLLASVAACGAVHHHLLTTPGATA
ncbi:hypothetical protein [Streptomyces sp. NPDC051211]|uniref:hypothetical protein n=1 Tax=Streptomyces sp. NPDC051211 TaxID=3154643 RepID=UPI00344D6F2E